MEKKTTKNKNEGSVLIVAIIITAVILSIGITISSILEKEVVRQIYGRHSQIAMNVANSALECVLFNDFRRGVFQPLIERRYDNVDCGNLYQVRKGSDWSVTTYKPSADQTTAGASGTATYQFVVIRSERSDVTNVSFAPCAHVTVARKCVSGTVVRSGGTVCRNGAIETTIEVRGYNRCASGEAESARKLVRRFKVRY